MSPTLDLTNPTVLMGVLVVGLAALTVFARNLVGMWSDTRRKPSADEVFATKIEIKELEQRDIARWNQAQTDNVTLETRHLGQLTDLERRVTGDINMNRSAAEAHFAAMETQVRALHSSVQALSADLNRAIGRLEGASAALHSAAVKITTEAHKV